MTLQRIFFVLYPEVGLRKTVRNQMKLIKTFHIAERTVLKGSI